MADVIRLEKLLEVQSERAEMLEKENAIKLEAILNLEDAMYEVRILDEVDGSPCWCVRFDENAEHSADCQKAREMTVRLWKK
jgi:hypothetical protein